MFYVQNPEASQKRPGENHPEPQQTRMPALKDEWVEDKLIAFMPQYIHVNSNPREIEL